MSRHYAGVVVVFFFMLFTTPGAAQIEEGTYVGASVGLGLVAPEDETDISGSGFYAQAEYILNLTNWFGVRPYAGFVIASGTSDEEAMKDYNMKSNAFLLGTKVRVAAPIPYVAPFIELGVGVSVGSFETYTPLTEVRKNGFLLHVPYSLGVAVGRRHQVDIKFTYYHHPSADQFSGAFAGGFSFKLD